MDTPPVPKPRSAFLSQNDVVKRPIPLPRTKPPTNSDRVSASNFFRSIGSVSKQITEDVAQKVTSSAKSANEKIEKSLIDGSKFAKGTLEKTITTSKAVKDSVAKSVLEGTAGIKFRISKKHDHVQETQKSVSLPPTDVSFFDNIQFHSPLLEQKKQYKNEEDPQYLNRLPDLQLNASHLDDMSFISNNSDLNIDTGSNFSYDSKEYEQAETNVNLEIEMTYDTPKTSRTNSILSIRSAPEIPERRKKRESIMEVMRQNSLYENWTLPNPSKSPPVSMPEPENASRPSKSTIYEFDPLNDEVSTQKYEGVSNELLLLESFLIGDTYGTIISTDNGIDESLYDFSDTDYFNPPTPPERLDSLFPNENLPNQPTNQPPTANDKDTCASWYVSDNIGHVSSKEEEIKAPSSIMQKFSNMLKRDVLNKSSRQSIQKVEIVKRPAINNLPVPYYCGTLNKLVSGVVEDLFKNSQSRFCTLSDQKLMFYSDPTNSLLKEAYTLDNILSVQVVLPLSSSTSNNSYCFELMVSNGVRCNPRKVLFSCTSASERRNWVRKIAENLTNGFPTKYTAEYTRCGWCYLKEGVSGEWRGAWMMLVRRLLLYYTDSDEMKIVDLRKTRCVVTKEAEEETKLLCPSDVADNLLLDCPQATLYLRFPHDRELKAWKYMIKLAAHNNGARIHHQQLTKEDVPVVVDKCISFIYAHGSLSEGIYRRAGSSLVLAELLARFRRDAWSVQLTLGQHSEHDVAGVLKRFFRDLPESLIPQNEYATLTSILDIKEAGDRFAAYKAVVTSLPLVVNNATRTLFAHLHFLHTMSHANKMNAENLASVWAPTIMPTALTSQTLQTAWSAKEQLVVRDLIANYEAIWEPTDVEIRREAAIRRVLVRVLSNSLPTSPKAAGDLRAWIYVLDKNNCHQVSLTPNKTSADICIELCEKAKMESHLLMIEEVICNESMRRILHLDDIVLDVVLNWSYWDEEDRKNNYLLVKENKILQEIDSQRRTLSSVCGELRIANESTKTFKLHIFEINNSKLRYYKDTQGSHKIEEWDMKDIHWYVGHEPKRNPQSRWAITFIPRNNKNKRSKDRPWFGCTIAGAVTEDQLKWMTAMMFAQHSVILPTPRLVIT